MFKWYNKKAKKNTIIGYLSRKYTLLQLTDLPTNSVLELPDTFETQDYFLELNQVLADSSWRKVKYVASSSSSIKNLVSSWKERLLGKKKETVEESENNQSSAVISEEPINTETNNSDETEEQLTEDNKSETSSLTSATSLETVNFNPNFNKDETEESDSSSVKSETNSEENNSDSEEPEELPYKGTYRYEFCTDDQGLILSWRTPSSFWRDDNFYEDKYFALDIAKYANSSLKIKTLEPLPLPRNLPASKVLFTPCENEKEFYQQEPNWINCYIWQQEPLKECLNCPTYLTSTILTLCIKCSQENETLSELSQEDWWERDWTDQSSQPSKSFWEKNQKLLIVLGLAVIAGVIIYNWNQE